MNYDNIVESLTDSAKLNKYNSHITKLENAFKSVIIKGTYEQYRIAPCFMLFTFIDLLRSIAILDNNHMISAGNIVLRTMFEILLDFLYCETDRKNLYLRFGEYKDVNIVLKYESLTKEMQSQINQEAYNKNILPNYKNFLKKYTIDDKKNRKTLFTWSGNSIKNRVDIVAKKIPEITNIYYNIYLQNCDYVHNYAETITQYGTYENNSIDVDYQKKYKQDNFVLMRQTNSLAELFYDEFSKVYSNKKLSDICF